MHQRGNSHIVEDMDSNMNMKLNIRNFPDPEDIYSTTLGAADTSKSFVNIPNVRDGDGNLITPDLYEQNLHDGTIVTVNVHLKL